MAVAMAMKMDKKVKLRVRATARATSAPSGRILMFFSGQPAALVSAAFVQIDADIEIRLCHLAGVSPHLPLLRSCCALVLSLSSVPLLVSVP